MVKITGADGVSRRLRGLAGQRVVREVGKALVAAGHIIQNEAQTMIGENWLSGKEHVPSKPGEPPKNDLGTLTRNIETVQIAPLRVEVSSNAPYSKALEFGTSKMAERPFMRPALARKSKEAVALVRQAVDRAIQQAEGA